MSMMPIRNEYGEIIGTYDPAQEAEYEEECRRERWDELDEDDRYPEDEDG